MKKTLRKETIAAMKQLPESVKTQADEELTQRLLELPAFRRQRPLRPICLLTMKFPQLA